MRDINKEDIINKIANEVVEYVGLIPFASYGMVGNPAELLKAFKLGISIGIEMTKKDAIRIIDENL